MKEGKTGKAEVKKKKIRAHELATELGLTFPDFREILLSHSIAIKRAISPIDEELAQKIRAIFTEKKEKAIQEQKEEQKKEEMRKAVLEKSVIEPPPTPSPLKETLKEEELKIVRPSVYDKYTGGGERRFKVGVKRKPKHLPAATEKSVVIPSHLEVESPISIRDFSLKSGIKASEIIKKLMQNGYLYTINDYLNDEVLTLIGLEFGIDIKIKKATENIEEYLKKLEEIDLERSEVISKPPVMVVMGHVDHGKTTLLDKIRNTNVAQREAGGITQHIGAYKVIYNGKQITFLDTPGHEAFTELRARGAQVTDMAILVVAADDGVMPQTIEAYNHAKDAKIPIIVAINKVDKPTANPQKVKNQLASYGIIPEEWGGDTIVVEVSALTGLNIEKLLESILLQAEVLNLKAAVNRPAVGYIIESKVSPSHGVEATLLIKHGELKKGDAIVAGSSYGKVRIMYDDRGKNIEKAYASDPVRVTGLSALPKPGEKFYVVESLEKAKEIAQHFANYEKSKMLAQKAHISLSEFYKQIELKKLKALKVILKTDVLGSLEVLKKSLEDMKFKEVGVQVIHSAVGVVSESDVLLADASDAIILRFNCGIEERASILAKERGIEVRYYDVIYTLIDDVKRALEGLLEPEKQEILGGKILVKAVFDISRIGRIAGCEVKSGKVTSKSKLKIYRDGKMIFEGFIQSLKRFKEDVNEVEEGLECGIKVKDYDDIKVGDEMEAYEIIEVPKKLI